MVSWSEPLHKLKVSSLGGDVGLWFIKRNSDLSFAPVGFLSPFTSIESVRIPVDIQMAYVPRIAAGGPGEAALLEILNTEDRSTQPSTGYNFIHWGAYDDWKPDLMREAYQRWSKESVPSRRAKGLAGLIRLGDVGALQTVAGDPVLLSEFADYVGFSISVSYRSPDVTGLGALGKLTRSIELPLQIRKSAAEALCSIHSKESISYLEALLDTNVEELEMLGAAGLAMFANGVKPVAHGGSANRMANGPRAPLATDETMRRFNMDLSTFHKSRAEDIAFWKSWLGANRAKIAAL